MELPNSHMVVEFGLDEIPSTLGVDSPMLCLHTSEVNPFHVIFDLNGILIITRFDKGFRSIILRLGLKEFLEKCLVQCQVCIWSIAQCHNIYNYLDQI